MKAGHKFQSLHKHPPHFLNVLDIVLLRESSLVPLKSNATMRIQFTLSGWIQYEAMVRGWLESRRQSPKQVPKTTKYPKNPLKMLPKATQMAPQDPLRSTSAQWEFNSPIFTSFWCHFGAHLEPILLNLGTFFDKN